MAPLRSTLASLQVRLIPSRDELVGGNGVGKARRTKPRPGIELVSVPRALEIVVAHQAFAQRAVLVRTHIGEGVEGTVLAHDGDALAVDVDGGGAPLGQLGEGAEQNEA